MKSKKLLSAFLLLSGAFIYLTLGSNSTGVMGASTTGCGGGGCHSSSSTTTLSLSGIPGTGWVPGTAYTLTFAVSNMSKAAAGFDLSVSGGTISGAPTGTMVMSGNEIHHTTPKAALSGTTTWSFTWTAPATAGSVTFSYAGNAVDNTGTSSNDAWALSSSIIASASTAVTPPSVISSSVSSITQTTAGISASVNANGASSSVSIDYGTTISYGSNQVTTPGTVIGNTPSAVTATLSGLTPGTLYHYRVKATNSAGTTNGPDAVFTTLPLSVNDLMKDGYRVYPNPVSDKLMIEHTSGIESLRSQVFTMSGQAAEVPVKRLSDKQYQLDLQSLTSGYYILELEIGRTKYPYPFLKK